VILLDHDGAGSVAGVDDGGDPRGKRAVYVGGMLRDMLEERVDGHVEALVADRAVHPRVRTKRLGQLRRVTLGDAVDVELDRGGDGVEVGDRGAAVGRWLGGHCGLLSLRHVERSGV
jgi:hypothetical protein